MNDACNPARSPSLKLAHKIVSEDAVAQAAADAEGAT
jgi:hypothetical protein